MRRKFDAATRHQKAAGYPCGGKAKNTLTSLNSLANLTFRGLGEFLFGCGLRQGFRSF
jgi:hypothetical protein